MILDTHVHFWKYDKSRDTWITPDMKVLREDYLPEHLAPTLRRNEVEGVIAVQADASETETHFLVELARKYDFIQGVVGWTDLASPKAEERLEYFSQYPEIRGYRLIAQAEADDYLASPEVIRGVRLLEKYGYTFDILVYARQLVSAITLCRACPGVNFILDHGAKPSIEANPDPAWVAGIRELASLPNVHCKLSGLFTEAAWKKWSAGDFYPYLDALTEAFGPQRLLFGSDWPVMLLSGMYVQWKSLVEKYMEEWSEEEREMVMGGNGERVYNLGGVG